MGQCALRLSAQVGGRSAIDSHSIGHHLVGLRFVPFRFEGVGVGRAAIEGQRALDREGRLLFAAMRRGQEPAVYRHRPADDPTPA